MLQEAEAGASVVVVLHGPSVSAVNRERKRIKCSRSKVLWSCIPFSLTLNGGRSLKHN